MVFGIAINEQEKDMLQTSVKFYLKSFKGMGLNALKLAFFQVEAPSLNLYLDEIEMIFTIQSLFKYGEYLSGDGFYEDSFLYRTLAAEMEQIRFEKKIKKATSADTLIA